MNFEGNRGEKISEALCILAAILLAVPTLVYWQWSNRGYPIGDSAGYMWTALKIFRSYSVNGILSGVRATYWFRLWKPIFHPVLAVPALLLTGGRALFAQAVTMIALQSLLAVAIYRLARHYAGRVQSVLVAAVLLNIHWVSANANDLNSELPFTLAFYATWASLLGSNFFSRKKQTLLAAVLLGLAVAIRPAEGPLLFAIPLVSYILLSLYRKKLSQPAMVYGLIAALCCSLPAVAILFFHERMDWPAGGNPLSLTIVFAGVLAGAAVCLRARKKRIDGYFPLFACVSVAVAVIWFGPYLWHAMAWIKLASFHKGGVNVEERIGFPLMFQKLSGAFFGPGSLVLFGLAAIFGWSSWRQKPLTEGAPALGGLLLVLALMMAMHITLGATSYNGDVRYYILEILALYLLALLAFLAPGRGKWLRGLMAFLLFCSLMVSQLEAYHVFRDERVAERADDFGKRRSNPPWSSEDPALQAWKQIEPMISRSRTDKPLVLSYPTQSDFQSLMEPGRFFLVSLESGIELNIEFPQTRLFDDWKSWHEKEGSRYDFYLVGPLERAVPELLPEIESERYKTMLKFKVIHDSTAAPVTLLLIDARDHS